MRGRTTQLADWVVRQASSAINNVGRIMRPGAAPISPPPASTGPGAIVVPEVQSLPAISPVPGTPFRRDQPFGYHDQWFGPGTPQTPMAPWADVAGRAFDYHPGYNQGSRPRQLTGVSFEQLRTLADSLDIARLCIETRKDQMGRLTWSVLPFQTAGSMTRGKADDRCRSVESFMRRPDRRNTWDQWQRMLLEDQMVIDAASIYVRRTKGGDVHSLEVVDGALIKPLLDITGRTPLSPEAAYQQILKGMPAVDYTADELLYCVRNPRSNHVYGLSNIEQIMMTVNIALRREIVKLKFFTENNMPEAVASTPADWSPEQVAKFQIIWDSLVEAKNREGKGGVKFFPGAVGIQPLRTEAALMGAFDEWLARVCCFCFSLPPTAFVQQQNRATAETAKDSALEEGLAPMMVWFKGVMDRLIQDVFGFPDLEFVWDDVKQIEVAEERNQDRADFQAGIMALDEIRAKRGLDPVGVDTPFVMGGPAGVMFMDDIAKAHANGVFQINPPAPPPQLDELGNPIPPPPGAMPPGGQPMPGRPGMPQAALPAPPAPPALAPAAAQILQAVGQALPQTVPPAPVLRAMAGTDPLAGVPANILAAVGLGPDGAAGRSVDVTRKDEIASDPENAHVPHPQVLATLRAAEALHGAR